MLAMIPENVGRLIARQRRLQVDEDSILGVQIDEMILNLSDSPMPHARIAEFPIRLSAAQLMHDSAISQHDEPCVPEPALDGSGHFRFARIRRLPFHPQPHAIYRLDIADSGD